MKFLTHNGLMHFWEKLSILLSNKADKTHTHNYAGSASAGGAATSALACTGNSATATKATQDSAGQQINTTYIKGLSVSGKTITYTKGNGTTSTITTQDTTYTHPTSSGNKHIPSGGSSGQFLKWSADGTAVWAADNNTTYSNMKGATSSVAGINGLVPAPAAGKQGQYLRGDGTWQTPPNTTYSVATTTANGLMSSADKKLLGNTDISNIGNGTVTGAVAQLNSNLSVIGNISDQVIGTVTCSKSTGTTTNLVSTWLAAGTYIIKGVISASPSGDGLLMYQLYNETADATIGYILDSSVIGGKGIQRCEIIEFLTITASTHISFRGGQSCDPTLALKGSIKTIRML